MAQLSVSRAAHFDGRKMSTQPTEDAMKARALGKCARLGAIAALGILGCSDSDSNNRSAAALGSRFQGPGFPGGGVAGLAYSIAAGPGALDCGDPTQFTFTQGPPANAKSTLICFYNESKHISATVEWIVETTAEDGDLIHARLTLNPDFVDNTYGANAIGWGNRKGPGGAAMPADPMGKAGKGPGGPGGKAAHSFMDLLGSDHAEIKLTDGDGNVVLQFKQDYVSADDRAPSGYSTLGVSGGDGRMIHGDPAALYAFSTSMERNLNACGLDTFTVDSPATDENYTVVAGAEAWDYRVVYDVWVHEEAFGSAGFGKASVDFVHASPSKQEGDSTTVIEDECPPDWRRYCEKPEGCETNRCVDKPDEACDPGDVPPPRCGDQPDGFCREGDVPPPPDKQDEPMEMGDAPL
jgi:hypothetical protein